MKSLFKFKRIYLDYASITPVDSRIEKYVKKVMISSELPMNPSSIHTEGVIARKLLYDARTTSARFINAHSDEIVFTGSGTESNNIAILGVVEKFLHNNPDKKYSDLHIVVSEIEHASVLETVRVLEKRGVKVELIPVDPHGVIDLDVLKKSLRENTILVSIMMVNNEIGTVEPIRDVVKIVRDFRKVVEKKDSAVFSTHLNYPLVHTDASQAPLYEEIDLAKLGVDLLTLDSHKVYGPRGVGLLYVRRGVELTSIIHGGGQERGLRSGTENIPGIVGFAHALDIAKEERASERARLSSLRDYFILNLKKIEPNIKVHGFEKAISSSPHIINVSIPDIDNEFFVLKMDAQGVACSTKSSCLRDEDESYVLKAIGASGDSKESYNESHTSVRFSLGRMTAEHEIDKTLKIIKNILNK